MPKRFREVREDPFLYYDIRHPFRIVKIWSFDFIIFAKLFNKVAYWLQYLNFYLFIFFYFIFRSRSRIVYTMDYLGCLLSLLGFTVIFESHQWSEKYAGSLKPFLKLASAIVVTNSFIGAHFEKTGFPKEKILVAPNGVGLDRFTQTVSVGSLRQNLGLPLGKKIVSYIGKYRTLGAEKGVRELVSAIARLSPKYPNLFLLLVGFDEDERREVESLCGSLNLPMTAYKIVLQVPQKQVPDYLRASDIFAMNYPETSHYSYNMSPMKLFEYMAAARPIVTSDLPTIREILDEKTAVFVAPDNQESLERGIEKLLLEENFGRHIAENAYELVKSYTWDKRAERILDFVGRDVISHSWSQ